MITINKNYIYGMWFVKQPSQWMKPNTKQCCTHTQCLASKLVVIKWSPNKLVVDTQSYVIYIDLVLSIMLCQFVIFCAKPDNSTPSSLVLHETEYLL